MRGRINFDRLLSRCEDERISSSVTLDELQRHLLELEARRVTPQAQLASWKARVAALARVRPAPTLAAAAAAAASCGDGGIGAAATKSSSAGIVTTSSSDARASAAPSTATKRASLGVVGDEWKLPHASDDDAARPSRWHLRHHRAVEAAPPDAPEPLTSTAAGRVQARSAATETGRPQRAGVRKRHGARAAAPAKVDQKQQQEKLKDALTSMAGALKQGALALNSNLRDSNQVIGTIRDDAESNLDAVSRTTKKIKERTRKGRCSCLRDIATMLFVLFVLAWTYGTIKMFPRKRV